MSTKPSLAHSLADVRLQNYGARRHTALYTKPEEAIQQYPEHTSIKQPTHTEKVNEDVSVLLQQAQYKTPLTGLTISNMLLSGIAECCLLSGFKKTITKYRAHLAVKVHLKTVSASEFGLDNPMVLENLHV